MPKVLFITTITIFLEQKIIMTIVVSSTKIIEIVAINSVELWMTSKTLSLIDFCKQFQVKLFSSVCGANGTLEYLMFTEQNC